MSAANTHVTFAEVDRSGDFRESLARVGGMTRAELLGAAGVTSAAMLAALAEPAEAWTGNDAEILQFDLQLEYLQSGMYQEALKIGKLSEQSREWARVIGAHELAHMKVIRSLLGSAAAKRTRSLRPRWHSRISRARCSAGRRRASTAASCARPCSRC
jgi:hypothetical protein